MFRQWMVARRRHLSLTEIIARVAWLAGVQMSGHKCENLHECPAFYRATNELWWKAQIAPRRRATLMKAVKDICAYSLAQSSRAFVGENR